MLHARMPRLAYLGWWALSCVSLAAMFHLWWSRERVLYVGMNAHEMRSEILSRAGLPLSTLQAADEVRFSWPSGVSYDAQGSEVTLSYFKYLVLPRMPSGSDTHVVQMHDSTCVVRPATPSTGPARPEQPESNFLAWLIPLALCGLMALALRRFRVSIPEGFALSSLAVSTAVVLSKAWSGSLLPAGVLIGLIAGVAALFLAIHPVRNIRPRMPDLRIRVRWNLLMPGLILGAVTLWTLLMAVVVGPDDWDAWAQWGPKAKVLFFNESALRDVRYFVPGSGDYPLLWPSLWAFSSWCSGGWEEHWSKAWGVMFMMLTAWQFRKIADDAGYSPFHGWSMAAAFVSMPAVPLIASWGYAEAPLWLMLSCATSRLLRWQRFRHIADLRLAGLFLAAAAFTKNEGLLFAALAGIWVAAQSFNRKTLWATLAPSLVLGGGWRLYVLGALGTSNHALAFLRDSRPSLPAFMEMLGRATVYVIRQWADVRQWNILVMASLVAVVWAWIKGDRKTRIGLLLPLGMWAALLGVALAHGQDWAWQLGVVLNRLTIQTLVILGPVLIWALGERLHLKRRPA